MTELLCDLLFGVGVMFAVFGGAGISLGLGAVAVSAIGITIDEMLRRRPG